MENGKAYSPDSELLTIRACAELMHLSRSRVYVKIKSGQLPSVQLAGRGQILVRRSALESALKPKSAMVPTIMAATEEPTDRLAGLERRIEALEQRKADRG